MYHLIKRRHEAHQSKDGDVIPWYSSNQVPLEELQIPIKATKISIGLLLSVACFSPGVLVGAYTHMIDLYFDAALLVANVIPILIMFVGVKNKAKIQQIPAMAGPSGLQFHEDI